MTFSKPSNPSPSSAQHCPTCLQADQCYKVSLIYLESSTRLNHHDILNQPELDHLLEDMLPDPSDPVEQDHLTRRFVQVFSPPPGGVPSTRRIHPDAAFSIFLLMLILVLYQIAITQARYLPFALGLLAAGILAYILGRGWVIRQYQNQSRQEQDAASRAENAVKRWAQLYFCSRDRGIYHPDENRLVPLENIREYLNEA